MPNCGISPLFIRGFFCPKSRELCLYASEKVPYTTDLPRFGGVTMFAGRAGQTRHLRYLLATARAVRRIMESRHGGGRGAEERTRGARPRAASLHEAYSRLPRFGGVTMFAGRVGQTRRLRYQLAVARASGG